MVVEGNKRQRRRQIRDSATGSGGVGSTNIWLAWRWGCTGSFVGLPEEEQARRSDCEQASWGRAQRGSQLVLEGGGCLVGRSHALGC